jgi:hypothetical protein
MAGLLGLGRILTITKREEEAKRIREGWVWLSREFRPS